MPSVAPVKLSIAAAGFWQASCFEPKTLTSAYLLSNKSWTLYRALHKQVKHKWWNFIPNINWEYCKTIIHTEAFLISRIILELYK